MRKSLVLSAVSVVTLALAGSSRASLPDLSQYGWQVTSSLGAADNDLSLTFLGASSDGKTLQLEKYADFQSTAPYVLTFTRIASTAYTQFAIQDETVINDSGSAWTQFGFSVDGPAAFDSAQTSALFFSAPFTSAAYSGPISPGLYQSIVASGGTLPTGTFPANLWTPGGDPAAASLYIVSPGTFSFTESPAAIPEPASAALLLLAPLALCRRAR